MGEVIMLLDYATSINPSAKICYKSSGMNFYVHINVFYLSVAKARSHAGGLFFSPINPKTLSNPLNTVCPSMERCT